MSESFLDGKVTLHRGDCLEVMAALEPDSVDSVVCDPPYHLTSIVKRFGGDKAAPCQFGTDGAYARASKGFMGKQWDGGGIAFDPATWALVLRVLKPGGHLLAFSGTRTYHRMACAIEDAGFEIRDQIGWTFGSGFPKSHNISARLSDASCQCEMRPMRHSDVSEAMPTGSKCGEVLLAGVSQQGASIAGWAEPSSHARGEQSGMEGRGDLSKAQGQLCEREIRPLPPRSSTNGKGGRLRHGTSSSDGETGAASADSDGMCASSRSSTAQQSPDEFGALAGQSQPQISGAWPLCDRCGKPIIPDGIGSALKPAWEPICLARKPLSESSIAANVLKHGTGGINVDGCRVGVDGGTAKGSKPQGEGKGIYGAGLHGACEITQLNAGRWPANLIHDGSEEVLAGFPETVARGNVGDSSSSEDKYGFTTPHSCGSGSNRDPIGFCGTAARFFYTAKADADDRLGSKHPTVKPLDLIQYLVRLVTPRGGVVLDPFAGTGTCGEAAFREGMAAILIEREQEYQADIVKRMGLCLSGPYARRAASVPQLPPHGLFEGLA